ncbi:MAG TPA: CTP synthase [Candidatus Paceibacterota bacterium]|jgi:CTP synthase|nr:CTP synthase [Candidatus Paceibacterota bacterium]
MKIIIKDKTKKNLSQCKYIFVVGGVISGVGKGVASSSIGLLMQSRGYKVTSIKIDPYINIDAGTMNPTEHGEVFVLDDGYECDQDMGNYERFLDTTLTELNYMTTGRVYQQVINKERNLEYKGKNVEVVPDVPLEVIHRIKEATKAANADITIIEIGGTAGEYQNVLFLEAARMLKVKYPTDVAFVLVSYLPVPSNLGEMKTKPTQYASRTLNSAGVQADIIIARGQMALDHKRKEKIALFCNVPYENVISAPDVKSIYDVPLNFEKDKIGETIEKVLGLPKHSANLSKWKKFVSKTKNGKEKIKIAVVGKYFDSGDFVLSDVYISVLEALKLSSYESGVGVDIACVNAKDFENKKASTSILKNYDGIIVPGGFGESGVEGIISAIAYARINKIPYFGLCYGMQLMVIEYARNVLNLKDANTREIDPNGKNTVIDLMEDQKEKVRTHKLGGSMRLGAYPARLKKGTIAERSYGTTAISERHRHRYEVNNAYREAFEKAGLIFSGLSPDGNLCEIAELPEKEHPFYLGTQFHPEFKAHPLHPHPLFTAFIRACIKNKKR